MTVLALISILKRHREIEATYSPAAATEAMAAKRATTLNCILTVERFDRLVWIRECLMFWRWSEDEDVVERAIK